MKDVATLAGVSLKTVSRVVNDEGGVCDDLVARVRKAADQLDFRPHLGASTLRRTDGKTRTIGLLVHDVANSFYSALHRGVEDVAWERGVQVLTASVADDPDRERGVILGLTARRVDGIIVTPTQSDHGYLQTERRAGTAFVFVDREPIGFQADAVVVDNEAASAVAVNHLISHGHRRIGLITDQLTIDTARQRRDGYVRALRESGIVVDQALMRHVLFDSEDALRVAFAELLDAGEPPTALFTAQGLVTIAAVRALRERGLQHRVALVGFDDVALADLLDPPITVIAQDPHLIGATAARRLFARLDGKVGPPRVEVIPTRLVARGSGETVADGGPSVTEAPVGAAVSSAGRVAGQTAERW